VNLGEIEWRPSKGAAIVPFETVGPGRLHIGGAGVHQVGRTIEPAPGNSLATYKIAVRAIGPALAELRRNGHVTVVLRLRWQPEEQPVATETRKLTLVAKKSPG
jgi:hypothetical protein